jgi:beta-N-acetylhexosaminidase
VSAVSAPGSAADLPAPAALRPEEAAGQLVCVPLRDYAGDRAARQAFLDDLERHGWGGVIVFGGDLDAVEDLLAEAGARAAIPLLATGDFERGFGQQFPRGGTSLPPLMALGAAGDPALARAAGLAAGREMRARGFHVDYAPVADLAIEPANPIVGTRAAGDDPELVAAIVAASVEGLQAAGVAAAVKHFPGHGRTTVDSHEVLPVVDAARELLERTDLVPFRAGLAAGSRLVMTAHVAYPALEPDGARDRPATFSRAIATDLLRGAMGFDGLVCSDALMMGAVAGEAPEAAALRALEAGIDWLLYPPDPPRVHTGLAAAIRDGGVSRGRVDEALERILALKAWSRAAESLAEPRAAGSAPARPIASAAALAEEMAAAALAADPPAPPPGTAWPDRAQWIVVLDGAIAPEDVVLARELAPAAAQRIVVVDTSADEAAVRGAIDEAAARATRAWVACAVFSPVRAWKNRPGLSLAGRAAVEAALSAAEESVLIVFSNPRIVEEVRPPSRTVWAFGEDAASQRAAVSFLRGARPAVGRVPLKWSP